MKFPYIVNLNGIVYPAGTEVPVGVTQTPVENKKSEVTTEDNTIEHKYSKSEIMLMKSADLQKLADAEGIEDAYETSGNKLKSILIEHFGL